MRAVSTVFCVFALSACTDSKARDFAECRMETIRVLSQAQDSYHRVVQIDFMSYCMETKGYKLALKDEGGRCPYGIGDIEFAGADTECFRPTGWLALSASLWE